MDKDVVGIERLLDVAIAGRCACFRATRRRQSIAGCTGFARASTRWRSSCRASPPSCWTPAPTWGPRAPPISFSALTALNRNGKDFADLVPDGRIGPQTLAALDGFLEVRGKRGGETGFLHALEAMQGERYVRLAERCPANEALLYDWIANPIGTRWSFEIGRPSGDFNELRIVRNIEMAIFEAIIAPMSKLFDKIIPDPQARDRAKLELIKLQGEQEAAVIAVQMEAMVAEGAVGRSVDQPRAPVFSLHDVRIDPVVDPDGPDRRGRPAHGDRDRGRDDRLSARHSRELYALLGTGYLGYTAARAWDKAKGAER